MEPGKGLMRTRARRSVVDHPPGTGEAAGSNPAESTKILKDSIQLSAAYLPLNTGYIRAKIATRNVECS